jgi:hypothetical protein
MDAGCADMAGTVAVFQTLCVVLTPEVSRGNRTVVICEWYGSEKASSGDAAIHTQTQVELQQGNADVTKVKHQCKAMPLQCVPSGLRRPRSTNAM